MRIDSNITEVISRLRQHRADVATAINRSLLPDEEWLRLARHYAERTLLALAQPNERVFIPDFIHAVSAVAFNGLILSLDGPRYTKVTAQMNLPIVSEGKFGPLNIPDESLPEFEQQVRDWVEQEKRWDVERDGERNAANLEAKAQWITYIMLSPHLATVSYNEGRVSEQEARDKLLPHVVEYLQQRQNMAGLQRETADLWLRTVLLQWTAMVHERFPIRLRAELDLLRRKKQKALL